MAKSKKTENVFAQDAKKAQENLAEIVDKGAGTNVARKDIAIFPVRLPASVHEKLRQQSFDTKESMNSIAVRILERGL